MMSCVGTGGGAGKLDTLEYVVVEAGNLVFREGDRGYCAYLIEKGVIEISVVRSGERIVPARRGQGYHFFRPMTEQAALDLISQAPARS